MFITLSFLFLACQSETVEETLEGTTFVLDHSDGFEPVETWMFLWVLMKVLSNLMLAVTHILRLYH